MRSWHTISCKLHGRHGARLKQALNLSAGAGGGCNIAIARKISWIGVRHVDPSSPVREVELKLIQLI